MDLKLLCEPCNQRDIISTASQYCTTCQELQCKDCTEVHKSSKATRSHLMVYVEDYQASAKWSDDLQVAQACTEHHGRKVDFYCCSHGEYLCSVCLLTKLYHRNCKTIVQLSSWASDSKKSQFHDKIFDDLNKVILKAKYTRKELQESHNNSIGVVKQMSDRLDNIREKFIALFEQQKTEIIKHVEETVSSHTDKSKQMLQSIEEHITTAEYCEKFLKELIMSGRDSDVFHSMLLAIDEMEGLNTKTEETRQQSSAIHITFENSSLTQAIEMKIPVINYKLEKTKLGVSNVPLKTTSIDDLYSYICKSNTEARVKSEVEKEAWRVRKDECISENTMDVKNMKFEASMNDIVLTTNVKKKQNKAEPICSNWTRLSRSKSTGQLYEKSRTSVTESECATSDTEAVSTTTRQTITFEHTDKFDISFGEFKGVWVGGIICLHDNRLVLSDYLNNRLIVLNRDHQTRNIIPISDGPRFMSLLNQVSFLVCLIKRNKIILMKVNEEEIKVGAYLRTRFRPKTAQGLNSDRILVSMKDEIGDWHIDILDHSGTLIQTLQIKELYDGYKIAVQKINDELRIIQYCDVTEKVRCLKVDGEIVFSYKIKNVSCVLTDNKGNIFIVRYTGEVCALSPNGKWIGNIRKMSMYNANYATFSTLMDKIYITQYKDPTVHVLTICNKTLKH